MEIAILVVATLTLGVAIVVPAIGLVRERLAARPDIRIHVLKSWPHQLSRDGTDLQVLFAVENGASLNDTILGFSVEFEGAVFSTTVARVEGEGRLSMVTPDRQREQFWRRLIGARSEIEFMVSFFVAKPFPLDARVPARLIVTTERAGDVLETCMVYQPQ